MIKTLSRLVYTATKNSTVVASLTLASSAQAVVVLQYHHVDDNTPDSTSTSIQLFKQHLTYLADNGFNVVSLPDIVNNLKENIKSKEKTVAITFDDGYSSIYKNAYPLLKQYNFPFTIFINTAPIEANQKSHVSWEQLKEMKSHDGTIANHTHNHSHLINPGQPANQWKASFVNEIETAQKILNKHLDQDIKLFAYPYGEFDNTTNGLLRDMGYIGFGQQSGAIGTNMDLQSLPRYPASNQYGSFPAMATKLNSEAFEDVVFKPTFGVINESSENPPKLEIEGPESIVSQINCFGSSVGALTKTRINSQHYRIDSPAAFNARRFRFNCTARSNKTGNFQWISIPWVNIDKPEY